jgi:hypothetical protein
MVIWLYSFSDFPLSDLLKDSVLDPFADSVLFLDTLEDALLPLNTFLEPPELFRALEYGSREMKDVRPSIPENGYISTIS